MSLEKTHEHILSKNCQIQIFGLGYVGFPLTIRPYSAGSNVIYYLQKKKVIRKACAKWCLSEPRSYILPIIILLTLINLNWKYF